MRRMKKFSIVACVALIMAVFLGGCGSAGPLAGDPVVGTWTMTGAEYAGITLTADDLVDAMGGEMPTFVINEDGSAVFSFNGEDGSGDVAKNDDGTYTLSDDTDTTLDFELKDNTLRLQYTEMSMVMIFEQK
ncbi:MAG: lipocalin family protein [Clostridiales bacterium]|nr:lipocalin family protein [Clostridiales bacterium]MDD6539207.1 lipocalin family protein [Bacillota bacterium]